MRCRTVTPNMVFSILLIVVGTLFFLDNIEVIRFYDIWRFWPLALIGAGVERLWKRRNPAGWLWGSFLILCGALWLGSNLHLYRISPGTVWPLGLITWGMIGLIKALETRESRSFQTAAPSSGSVREFVVFSGSKKKLEGNFEGGEIVCIFGGVDLNLRKCTIATPNNEVVIDVSITFGGVEIRIPPGWRVANQCVAIFGACEDKTVAPRPESGTPAPVLVISGQALFGAVNIEN